MQDTCLFGLDTAFILVVVVVLVQLSWEVFYAHQVTNSTDNLQIVKFHRQSDLTFNTSNTETMVYINKVCN